MTEAEIDAYLYYGYVPRVNGEDPFWILEGWDHGEARRRLENLSLQELVAEGIHALKTAMESALDGLDGTTHQHVVLLSGGFDSRAVLGALLERFSPREIVAATFGLPGFPDFDLARRVTRSVNLRHELADARSVPCTTELIAGCMKRLLPNPYPPVLQGPYLSYTLRCRLGTDVTYWNGFLGDPISGSHLARRSEHSWEAALQTFERRNRGAGLARPGYDPAAILPRTPFVEAAQMTYPEQLDFAVRQPYCIYTRTTAGHRHARLFQQSAWVNFMLNVPLEYRRDQVLYREILRVAYPRLFRIPTTREHGVPLTASRWRRSIVARASRARRWLRGGLRVAAPTVLGYMLREHADVVRENLEDLQKRGVVDWLDVLAVWRDHQAGARDAARELNTLVSLEANLKAEES